MARVEKEKTTPAQGAGGKFMIRKSSTTTNGRDSWVYFKEMSRNNITYASGKQYGKTYETREAAEADLVKIKADFLFRQTDVYEVVETHS